MDSLFSMLQRAQVGWADVVDILIAAIAIYELLKLMRGTRAIQMGIGVGLIIGVFYLSEWWHLDTVNWLIRNIAGYVVFAAIVVFQSEIRRTLAHLGRARFFRYLTRTESNDEIVEELVAAATMLASTRTGAIIAVERDIGLRNYIEGGVPLDATLTSDLLLSVFQPTVAAPRRRDHRAGRPRGGGGLLSAAVGEPRDQQGLRHAAPCRHRSDRGRGRGDHRRLRRDRSHLGRAGRTD